MVQTTCLASSGPVLVAAALYHVVNYKTVVSIKKHEIKGEKDSPMAQTTRLASFGPVQVLVGITLCCVVNHKGPPSHRDSLAVVLNIS